MLQPLHNVIDAPGVGQPKWATAMVRKTITSDPNDINVTWSKRNSLIEDLRCLVHERQHQPLHNFARRNVCPLGDPCWAAKALAR